MDLLYGIAFALIAVPIIYIVMVGSLLLFLKIVNFFGQGN